MRGDTGGGARAKHLNKLEKIVFSGIALLFLDTPLYHHVVFGFQSNSEHCLLILITKDS